MKTFFALLLSTVAAVSHPLDSRYESLDAILDVSYEGEFVYRFAMRGRDELSCIEAQKQPRPDFIELHCDDDVDRVAIRENDDTIIFAGIRMTLSTTAAGGVK